MVIMVSIVFKQKTIRRYGNDCFQTKDYIYIVLVMSFISCVMNKRILMMMMVSIVFKQKIGRVRRYGKDCFQTEDCNLDTVTIVLKKMTVNMVTIVFKQKTIRRP